MEPVKLGNKWIYRQPSGCLEIGQNNLDNGEEHQDIIHICEQHDQMQFLDTLAKFLTGKGI